jgi:hypothetical protein
VQQGEERSSSLLIITTLIPGVGHGFSFIRRTIDEIVFGKGSGAEEIAPLAKEIERHDRIPPDIFKQMGDLDLFRPMARGRSIGTQ